jgi:flagellar biosynthesis/type III secretory pathway protein FliH
VTADVGPSPEQRRHELAAAFADELAELRESVRTLGYREGRELAAAECAETLSDARESLQAEYSARLGELAATAANLQALSDRLDTAVGTALADLEPLAVEIAFTSLVQMFGRAEHYRAVLADLVSHAIDGVCQQNAQMRVLMDPHDAALMRDALDGNAWVERIVVDPALSPGSCVVELGPRCLDASLTRQMDALRQRLLQICSERGHGDVGN